MAAALPAAAAEPEAFLFANLVTAHRGGDSEPFAVGACRDAVLFSAVGDQYGSELWRTDGTPRGTFLLADLCTGRCSATLNGLPATGLPDLVFFQASRGEAPEVWRSDCTEAGTFRLGSGGTGPFVSAAWLAERQRLIYRGYDEAGGAEPWVTNGMPAGTRRLVDVMAGAAGSDPDTFSPFAGFVWFTARDPQHGRELWRSDGTPAGTVRVTDLVPGPGDGAARVLGTAGSYLVFEGLDGAGLEPWAVAPGVAPRRLGDLAPGAEGSRITTWSQDGRRMLFHTGHDTSPRTEVWSTDGTPAGTRKLLETDASYLLYTVAAMGSRTLFFHEDAAHGRELWSTDGTPAGTHAVVDLCPGPCSAVDGGILFPFAGAWFFAGSQTAQDRELWRTDGTAAGTVRVADLCPGPCSSSPFGPYPDGLVIAGFGSGHETLWHTDGTAVGTVEIAGFDRVLPAGGVFGPGDATSAGTLLAADDGLVGREPWWTDGTAAGTVPLGDLYRGREDGSQPQVLTRFGNRFLFTADDDAERRGLWVSDGTVGGTRPLPPAASLGDLAQRGVRLAAGAGGVFVLVESVDVYGNRTGEATLHWTDGTIAPRLLATVEVGPIFEYEVFTGDAGGVFLLGPGLWHSDGTVAGTRRLVAASGVSEIVTGVLLGGRFHFVARGGGPFPDYGLAMSDGTPGGTGGYFGDPLWIAGNRPGPLVADGAGGFYFIADHGEDSDRIWHSDGTAAGTRVAVDFAESPQPRGLTVVGDRLFFRARGDSGDSLWTSDGTTAGTLDLLAPPPTTGSPPGSLDAVAFGGEFVYQTFGSAQPRFWRSDGTRGGTVPILDLAPAGSGLDLYDAYLWTAGGHLLVTAQYFGEPWTLWLRESLDQPSRPLGEFAVTGYSPSDFVALGNRVYFAAEDDASGRELWAVDFAAPAPDPGPRCVADAEHLCLADGRFRLRADWRNPRTGNSGVAGALPFPGSERTGLFWFFNPANVELIVKMLDGSGTNGFFWTFYGALSDVEYWIDVEDLVTGARRTYHNPPLQICGRADTTTFDNRPSTLGQAHAASALGAAAETGCATGPTSLCLLDRFRVEVDWRNQRTGNGGTGTAVPGTDRSGYFWFFRDDNVELVVKVLDGRPVNGRFWVFYGALTDVEYTITVTDTETAAVASYHNPPGEVCGDADTTAF